MKLLIKTHDGVEYETEAINYDPQRTNSELNNSEISTVLIGDVIISRVNVKSITKAGVDPNG